MELKEDLTLDIGLLHILCCQEWSTQLRNEQGGEDAVVAVQKLRPHVRDGHRGEGPSAHPMPELDELVAAAEGPVVAQKRRRGAA